MLGRLACLIIMNITGEVRNARRIRKRDETEALHRLNNFIYPYLEVYSHTQLVSLSLEPLKKNLTWYPYFFLWKPLEVIIQLTSNSSISTTSPPSTTSSISSHSSIISTSTIRCWLKIRNIKTIQFFHPYQHLRRIYNVQTQTTKKKRIRIRTVLFYRKEMKEKKDWLVSGTLSIAGGLACWFNLESNHVFSAYWYVFVLPRHKLPLYISYYCRLYIIMYSSHT